MATAAVRDASRGRHPTFEPIETPMSLSRSRERLRRPSQSRSRSRSRSQVRRIVVRQDPPELMPLDMKRGIPEESPRLGGDSSSSSDTEVSEPKTPPKVPVLRADLAESLKKLFPPSLAVLETNPEVLSPTPLPASWPPLPETYETLPAEVGEKEKGTPDDWVLREDKMVRLTGRWPFNSEAPLSMLYNAGFLTPSPLFYVRNHGVVPRVSRAEAEAWTIDFEGMVKNPMSLSVADLQDPAQFETITLPITLVCAGNRRKEQNTVRKSLGFSWGPAGLSTALFTGVYLCDVLEKLCPQNETIEVDGKKTLKRAQHVIFEGAEDLPDGKYGTSQLLRWCKSKEKGLMLAWAMNGLPLEPDHGFPIRLVVPGQIGGRSVKWLKKVIVSDIESQHHLHFWDNKVLPANVMPEEARSERSWWYDPRYIINDLNTNGAIAYPAHDEVVTYKPAESEDAKGSAMYTLKGYAYGGGGRRVTRVEISLDAGATWLLCNISYPEDLYRDEAFEEKTAGGWGSIDLTERDECFCWCFWDLPVPVSKLAEIDVISLRAMDQSLHVMGKSMYWNATGMMNNWWYRVAIHKEQRGTETLLRFEHPTQPGTMPGGWMERMKELDEDILNPEFTTVAPEDVEIKAQSKEKAKKPQVIMTKEGVSRKITMAELQAHNKEEEPWFVVHGEVYDGTGFLSKHPGGSESITLVAGEDATEDFMAIHSADAKNTLRDYHVGTLVVSADDAPAVVEEETTEPGETYLHKTKWKKAKLVKISKLNHDSRVFTFELETPEQLLGLPTGQHVYCRLRRKVSPGDAEANGGSVVEGELVQRAYTPTSREDARGYLELLIKVYHRTPEFTEGGKMTLGLEELELGELIEIKGPLGSFQWLGKSVARWRNVERTAKNIGMVCGGSGITPIYQVLRAIANDPDHTDTRVWILNANKTEADILLREELDLMLAKLGDRAKNVYILSKPPADWPHARGRITKDLFEANMPPPGDDSLILICGPEPMIEHNVKPAMAELGWDVAKSLVVF